MAALAWEVVRSVTTPVAKAAFAAAIGLSSGLLFAWSTRRHITTRMNAMQHDFDCRWLAHRVWATNPERARDMLPEENQDGLG